MLKAIFDFVEHESYKLRKNNRNADGQLFWQPIKKILSKSNIKVSRWKHIKEEHKEVMNIPEYIINGYGDKTIIELNHFLIQTIRIPLLEEPNIRKIIQLALNIGQYTGSGGKKEEWMTLDYYLSKENIKHINSELPPDLLSNIKMAM